MYHTTEKTFLTVAVIGFERTLYSVNEDDMVAVLVARVLSGALSGPVVVRVNTDDGTALGMLTVCVVCVYMCLLPLCVCMYVCMCVYYFQAVNVGSIQTHCVHCPFSSRRLLYCSGRPHVHSN